MSFFRAAMKRVKSIVNLIHQREFEQQISCTLHIKSFYIVGMDDGRLSIYTDFVSFQTINAQFNGWVDFLSLKILFFQKTTKVTIEMNLCCFACLSAYMVRNLVSNAMCSFWESNKAHNEQAQKRNVLLILVHIEISKMTLYFLFLGTHQEILSWNCFLFIVAELWPICYVLFVRSSLIISLWHTKKRFLCTENHAQSHADLQTMPFILKCNCISCMGISWNDLVDACVCVWLSSSSHILKMFYAFQVESNRQRWWLRDCI